MAEADDYEVTLNRILARARVNELSDLVRAMRTGIAAEMKPKYGDNAPAFKGSQVLSFLSSRGVKQPDERMFVSRELLSRGFIAHVVAGSKQPNVLDFHDGNRYRFTQKDVTHARMRRSIQPGADLGFTDTHHTTTVPTTTVAPPSPPSRHQHIAPSASAPINVSPRTPISVPQASSPASPTFHHIRPTMKPGAKQPDSRLLLSAARVSPAMRPRGSTDGPPVENDPSVSSPPTSPLSRSAALSAAPRPVAQLPVENLPPPPSSPPSTTSARSGGEDTGERRSRREKKERKEKKERERKEKEREKERKLREEALSKDYEPPRPSRAPLPPPRFMEKPVHIAPQVVRSASSVPPPPLGDVLGKGEQEYLKVLHAGFAAFIEPLAREKLLSPQEVKYVAGNLAAIIALHETINTKLKENTPAESAIIAVAGAIPTYLLYIANLTAALELVEDARNEPRFLAFANQQATQVNCTFETYLQLPQRHLQFYLRLRHPYAAVIPASIAETLSAAQKTLEERTKNGVDSRVWDLQRRLTSATGEQTTLPRGALSLDGVFERRDKPNLKHIALFLFADRLLCASVSCLPHYRIKELLSLHELEVIDIPDAPGRKFALRIRRQQKPNAPPLLVCFPSEEDKVLWTESLPGVRRMLRVPLEL